MSRGDAQVNFRMPHELREALAAHANRNKRSITAEIVARLWETIHRDAQRIRVNLRLPNETLRQLGEIAARKGLTLDQVIEEALQGIKP